MTGLRGTTKNTSGAQTLSPASFFSSAAGAAGVSVSAVTGAVSSTTGAASGTFSFSSSWTVGAGLALRVKNEGLRALPVPSDSLSEAAPSVDFLREKKLRLGSVTVFSTAGVADVSDAAADVSSTTGAGSTTASVVVAGASTAGSDAGASDEEDSSFFLKNGREGIVVCGDTDKRKGQPKAPVNLNNNISADLK